MNLKTIQTSALVGSLLATLAMAQPSPSAVADNGPRALAYTEIQPALYQADPAAQAYRRWGLPHRAARQKGDDSASAHSRLLVYVITGGLQFGAVDLRSGTFLPIGPGLPPDVGGGLVPGRGKSLLTLSFSGNLEAIDPATGKTTVVGATGMGDCSTPTSRCGPNSATVIGQLDDTYYATDFAQNLYSVNPRTGAAKLIGPTGIPAITFIPFSANPDGSVNVYAESLFSARGKLYANFATASLNPATGTVTPIIPGALYQINPETGHARLIAPTDTNLTSVVNVNETIYAFDAATGQVVTLDVTNGLTTAVSDLDPTAGVIGGATPVRPGEKD
jgi:hypothetical protein